MELRELTTFRADNFVPPFDRDKILAQPDAIALSNCVSSLRWDVLPLPSQHFVRVQLNAIAFHRKNRLVWELWKSGKSSLKNVPLTEFVRCTFVVCIK